MPALLIGLPLAALATFDIRLGVAGVAGVVAGVIIGRGNRRAAPAAPPTETIENAMPPRARDQMHEIELERVRIRLAEMERMLDEELADRTAMLALFDSVDDADPATSLRTIKTRLRLRQQAAAPAETVPLGDVLVACVGGKGWAPGDLTVTGQLPTVVAPRELLCSVVAALFEAWSAIPPITIGGRIDGGLALVRFDGLGVQPEPDSAPFRDAVYALEHVDGSLIPHDTGMTLAVPLAGRRL
jgi:hypothetical protein